MTDTAKTERIRHLNDAFRKTGQGGKIVVTLGIRSLGALSVARLLEKIRDFDEFGPDNDPYGEHDFGRIDHEGSRVFWKIDYYDRALEYGSDDPADPAITCRLLTIMLAEEY